MTASTPDFTRQWREDSGITGVGQALTNPAPARGDSTQEAAGEVTGDRELADEGRAEASVEEGVEKVEDAVGGVVDSVTEHLGK